MKIAVAALKKDENSEVSPVGGRAPFYLIFDGKKLVKAMPNPFRFGGGGAGTGVAQMLGNEGVEMAVCGKFGPNMEAMLKEKGIIMKTAKGKTAREIIEGVSG
jgi:predicted Fe-Mo cluster-binding NifX family protein